MYRCFIFSLLISVLQEEYLKELLKVVIDSISGKKSIKVPPELHKEMEAFLLKEALQEEVTLQPLSASKAKIKVKSIPH